MATIGDGWAEDSWVHESWVAKGFLPGAWAEKTTHAAKAACAYSLWAWDILRRRR